MSDFNLDTIQSLKAQGNADCLRSLLDEFERAKSAIPWPYAGGVSDYQYEVHPSVSAVEAIEAALAAVLTRCAADCAPADLRACAALGNVDYQVAYGSPGQDPVAYPGSVWFGRVRELAAAALRKSAG